jgi:uncharacterized SAM-binding protein YcdF (DUF218 family)
MMSVLVQGIVRFIFSVAGLSAVLGMILVVWRCRPTHSRARGWLTASAVVLVLASIPAVPSVLIYAYTRAYRAFTRTDLPDARVIVLLGAGTVTVPGAAGQLSILEPVGASRVVEAARVYRLFERPLIISSGGSRRREPSASSAWAMRSALVELGVPFDRIRLEDRSFSTADEAALIAPMLGELGVTRFVLVTSASHMRRAIGAFRAAGMAPVAAIAADYGTAQVGDPGTWLLPSAEGLRLTRVIAHEWMGLPYYWLNGWSSAGRR